MLQSTSALELQSLRESAGTSPRLAPSPRLLRCSPHAAQKLRQMGAAEGIGPEALLSQVVRLRYEATQDLRRRAVAHLFSALRVRAGSRGNRSRHSTRKHLEVRAVRAVVLGTGESTWAVTEASVQLAWSLVPASWAATPTKTGPPEQRVELSLLQGLLSAAEVQRVAALLPRDFDLDRADVEMVPKRWIVIERAGRAQAGREVLAEAMAPLIKGRILPYVRHRLQCPSCLVCSSIVRRYSHALGERHRDPPHTDGQAFATVVIALSSAGEDYEGGLYVVTDPSRPMTVALSAGDAIVHRWDLQHGVQVERGTRVSWILWVQDSAPCVSQAELHQRSSFRAAAEAGHVVAMHILGTGESGRSEIGRSWLRRAAEAGFVRAMAQLGAALQGEDDDAALLWLRLAAESGDAGAQASLGMALLRRGQMDIAEEWLKESAEAGNPVAQNDLGMALLTGALAKAPEPSAAALWSSNCSQPLRGKDIP
ncbi:unnamed protein product, partial [Polarella glacialis]